jgi:Xaa-Pro aminopeptidase
MKKKVPSRLDALRMLIRSGQCTHILITDVVDVEYCCGFRASHALLLVSKSNALLCTDFRYRSVAQTLCKKNPEWTYVELPNKNFTALAEYCSAGSIVGIQSNVLTLDQYDRLKKALKKVTFIKVSAHIASVFVTKSETEIASIKKAAHIGDKGFSYILQQLKTGITESDVARLLDEQCRMLGSEKPSFDTMVLFGARSALPHGVPEARRLKKGDWVLFDFGCTVNGLASDMTRTVVFGSANARQHSIYAIVFKAQQQARSAVRAGAVAADVDACARNIITAAGYGDQFGHATGHGVGLRIHELPRVSATNKTPLQERAVITIEPGIYLPDFGGVRIEDTVVVRETGCDVLTRSSRRLIEVSV